eukprot:1385404-Amorphochlora_amoeboformis.AAC.2
MATADLPNGAEERKGKPKLNGSVKALRDIRFSWVRNNTFLAGMSKRAQRRARKRAQKRKLKEEEKQIVEKLKKIKEKQDQEKVEGDDTVHISTIYPTTRSED